MPPKLMSKDNSYVTPLQKVTKPKRLRVSKACEACRKRKIKCDGLSPCVNCKNLRNECIFKDGTPSISSSNNESNNKVQAPAVPLVQLPPSKNNNKVDRATVYKAIGEKMYPNLNISTEYELSQFLDKIPNNDRSVLQTQAQKTNQPQPPYSYLPSSSQQNESIKITLPPKDIALKLIFKTWNEACILFRFYHRPIFLQHFNSLYETSPQNYSVLQMRFLPLIYSVIACGSLFAQGDNEIDNRYLKDEGYKYFIAARKLIDLTNPTNLENIQTIFMLTIFLQCSAKISICYSYIGIALRSALRLNYHKPNSEDDYITSECKKRLFWTVYKFEIYINSMLNLPNCNLDVDDIDIGLPLDVDDINITSNQLIPQTPPDKLSSCGINNHHTKLLLVMDKIFKKLYNNKNQTIELIPKEVVTNLENELKIWTYELHPQLQYNNPHISKDYEKANKLLYLDFLHVEIMLYRPFITFLKPSTVHLRNFKISNGLKCFEISKEIIKNADAHIHLINGSYWFSIYTIFFALTCLIYYFLEIDNNDPETNHYIGLGKMLLMNLKKSSNTAERIHNLLNNMFENYNKSLKLTFSYEGQDTESSVKLQQKEELRKKQELEQRLAKAQALKNNDVHSLTSFQPSALSGISSDRSQPLRNQPSTSSKPKSHQPQSQQNVQAQDSFRLGNLNNFQNTPDPNTMGLPTNSNIDPVKRLTSEEPPVSHFESLLPNFLQESYELDSNGHSAASVNSNMHEFDEDLIDWDRIFANNEINLKDV